MASAQFCVARRLHQGFQTLQLPWESSILSGSLRNADMVHSQFPRSLFAPRSLPRFPTPGYVSRRSIVSCSCTISRILRQHAANDAEIEKLSASLSGARTISSLKIPESEQVRMACAESVFDPYTRCKPIPLWRRWLTRSGWRRTCEDFISLLKSGFALNKLSEVAGFSEKLLYEDALRLYKELNTKLAKGDITAWGSCVTQNMYPVLKNELERRESMWSSAYWELVEPVVSIRMLQARTTPLDLLDWDEGFIQVTLEITTKQRFEAYDAEGAVVFGDKTKEVPVRDIWVLERCLFLPNAEWRLCGGLQVTMTSPGFILDPYTPREHIPFWRWFTRSGWRRIKEDLIMELKSDDALGKLSEVAGYSEKLLYEDASRLYKELNTSFGKGDNTALRKVVTEKMYAVLKNELELWESWWSSVYWELVEPVVSIRTLQARMIGLDENDPDKGFVQVTLEITSKQRFEAYDAEGAVVYGNKRREVLERDIWVLERGLFLPVAEWRLADDYKYGMSARQYRSMIEFHKSLNPNPRPQSFRIEFRCSD